MIYDSGQTQGKSRWFVYILLSLLRRHNPHVSKNDLLLYF